MTLDALIRLMIYIISQHVLSENIFNVHPWRLLWPLSKCHSWFRRSSLDWYHTWWKVGCLAAECLVHLMVLLISISIPTILMYCCPWIGLLCTKPLNLRNVLRRGLAIRLVTSSMKLYTSLIRLLSFLPSWVLWRIPWPSWTSCCYDMRTRNLITNVAWPWSIPCKLYIW